MNNKNSILDLSYPGAASGMLLSFLSATAAEVAFQSFSGSFNLLHSAGRIMIGFICLYIIFIFSLYSFNKFKPNVKDLFFLNLVLLGTLVTVLVGRILALALTGFAQNYSFSAGMDSQSLLYAIPFAAGGLIIQAVRGIHYATVFAISITVLLGIYSTDSIIFTPFVLVTNLVGALSLVSFRSRTAYIKAGFNIAIASIPFALVSFLGTTDVSAYDILLRVFCVIISGFLCTALAAVITPVIEYFGGYVTDMRLIEMSTLDHPLLKELSVQAAGTWNHSMVIGMMVEAGATAINANPVLSRVGAYFHDIGKTKKPLYFVENQYGGENRHDKLSPSMSALIIRSHVKDGIELGRQHKLPQSILDMIAQHHGTSTIEYFYEKARTEAEEAEGDTEVDLSLYTYPGPKPQSKEAGLLMLADCIEPASRTLSEPSLDRIQGLVQKMINRVFASGQLDECDITLSDLHEIAKHYTRVLNSIYHQRIAYAEPAEKVSRSNDKNNDKKDKKDKKETKEDRVNGKEVGNSNSNKKQKSQSKNNGNKKDSEENLKRLGIDDGASTRESKRN